MKRLKFLSLAIAVAVIVFSCNKNNSVHPGASAGNSSFNATSVSAVSLPAVSNCTTAYVVTLESITQVGSNYEWVWSIQNPNPGNGSNGTIQNLSHWDITLGECLEFSDIVSGATSTDNITWTSFTPSYQQDMSMQNFCNVNTDSVIKFDVGTSGTAKTYCKLVISKNLSVDMDALAYYKSGVNTGCGTTCFPGFGCPEEEVNEGCSFSQGYWFAKPNLVWPGNVTVGGYSYTQTEGVAIWNSSNKGGIGAAKKVFLQVAAVKLSGSNVSPTATVWAQVQIAENWLATLPKLTAANVKSFNSTTGASAAVAAADSISNWIGYNHCE